MNLEDLSKRIEALRTEALFDEDLAVGLDCVAQEELIQVFSFLELARSTAMKAEYAQRRALASQGGSPI